MKINATKLTQIVLVVLSLIFSSGIAYPQNMNFYLTKENIVAVTSNSELIITDPINEKITTSIPEVILIEDTKKLDLNFESGITPTSKFVKLPFGYTWKKLSASCTLPIYLRRGMNYAHGTETTSGMGDLTFKLSYKSKRDTFNYDVNFCVKLPTGDANKQVNGYLVPLGTGSTDIIGHVNLSYSKNKSLIYCSLMYRLNGSIDRIAQITYPDNGEVETINYNIKYGNTFIFSAKYYYNFWNYASLVAGLSTSTNGKGSMDRTQSYSSGLPDLTYTGLDAGQSFIMADFNPAIVIHYSWLGLNLGCKIPLYTRAGVENTNISRKVMYSFSLLCTIF